MTQNLKIASLALISCAFFFSSCDKENKDSVKEPLQDAVTVAQKIKKLGYDTSHIIPFNEGYIVENDIYIKSTDLDKKPSEKQTTLRIAKNEQYRTNNLVTGFPRVLRIRFGTLGLPAFYQTSLNQAIQDYNDLKLDITFQFVSGQADIEVFGTTSLPSNVYASASAYPSNGNPGGPILINTNYFTSASKTALLTSTLKHELGHTLGLRHTDYFDRTYSCGYNPNGPNSETAGPDGAINIPGTPTGVDVESLMLACTPDDANPRGFVDNDIVALSYLYNVDHKTRAQIVHEFYSPGGQDHSYYINRNIPRLFNEWIYNGDVFRAFIQQAPGTQVLYEYYNPVSKDHCFSFVNNDPSILQFQNWQSNGTNFYAYQTAVSGSIPIYEFYSNSMTSHVYTPNINFNASFPQFTYQGLAFYALPL
ncbi:M57 family metalloprotease [Chitinophaga polysaccharea]|uniref:M57 family metalloprotease n=1 Tax=Chitinophaga polysaccharea TaxID=1293035 RepID=UPI001158B3FE|nr:M57 family metalloprotease [Chitinophaga polysaccharea]